LTKVNEAIDGIFPQFITKSDNWAILKEVPSRASERCYSF